MIVNIYLDNGRFLTSRVDENTSHLLGDSLVHEDKKYVVIQIEEREHIDYQTIVRVNSVTEKSEEIEVDEVIDNGI